MKFEISDVKYLVKSGGKTFRPARKAPNNFGANFGANFSKIFGNFVSNFAAFCGNFVQQKSPPP